MYSKALRAINLIASIYLSSISIAAQSLENAHKPNEALFQTINIIDPKDTVFEGEEFIAFTYSIKNITQEVITPCLSLRVGYVYDINQSVHLQYSDPLMGIVNTNNPIECFSGKSLNPGDSALTSTSYLDLMYNLNPGKYYCVIRCPFVGKGYAEKKIFFEVFPKKQPDYSVYQTALNNATKTNSKDIKTNPLAIFLKEQTTNVYYKTAIILATKGAGLNVNLIQPAKWQGDILTKMQYDLIKDPAIQNNFIKYSDHFTLKSLTESIASSNFQNKKLHLFKDDIEMYNFYDGLLKKLENHNPFYSKIILDMLGEQGGIDTNKLQNYSDKKLKNLK